MAAQLETVTLGNDESFFIGIFQNNLKVSTWHYHDTYEISFIVKGIGKRIVADSIEDFQPGDLVFIGKKLPHVWIADKEQGEPTLETVFLQFPDGLPDNAVLSLPEMTHVRRAVSLADRGVQITGRTLDAVSELMLQMPYLEGFQRLLHFFRILDTIGRSDDIVRLASEKYMKALFRPVDRRVAAIHETIMHRYREEIDLGELAAAVNLAEGSLCRLFKAETGMTVFEYLNKIRVDYACKMLMDPALSVTEICMDSGFNNVSHFNRQFRRYTGVSPTRFRKRFEPVL